MKTNVIGQDTEKKEMNKHLLKMVEMFVQYRASYIQLPPIGNVEQIVA